MSTQRIYIKEKKIRRFGKSIKMPQPLMAASDTDDIKGATSQPDKIYPWIPSSLNEDGTLAPEIGVPETDDEKNKFPLAKSFPELLDKHILSAKKLSCGILLIIIAFFFVDDNYRGKLENWNDVAWTLKKCGVVFILYLLFTLLAFIKKTISSK